MIHFPIVLIPSISNILHDNTIINDLLSISFVLFPRKYMKAKLKWGRFLDFSNNLFSLIEIISLKWSFQHGLIIS